MFTVARYWFSIGQMDAFNGVWDCPPVSAHTIAAAAYERGQMVAAGTARTLAGTLRKAHFYARNRASLTGTLR